MSLSAQPSRLGSPSPTASALSAEVEVALALLTFAMRRGLRRPAIDAALKAIGAANADTDHLLFMSCIRN